MAPSKGRATVKAKNLPDFFIFNSLVCLAAAGLRINYKLSVEGLL